MISTESLTDCGVSVFVMAFIFAALVVDAESSKPCKVLLQAKQPGAAVYSDEVAPASCPLRKVGVRLRYDARRHIVTAREVMTPGTQLGLVYVPRRPAVSAGEAVKIDATIGHVSVTRTAIALEPADFGQRFHVRTTDGLVLRAPALMVPRAEDRRRP